MINKRIVIHNYTCAANGICYRIAVNTKEGTILDTSVEVKTVIQALALVQGYLHVYYGEIEIHPGSIEEYNELKIKV